MKSVLQLLLCSLLISGSVYAQSSVSLPEDKNASEIISSLADGMLRKFRTRISDLQKTYSYKLIKNRLYLIYGNSDSGCAAAQLNNNSNMQISWSSQMQNQQLVESISYEACNSGEILREVLIRTGAQVRPLSVDDIVSIKRPLKVDADQPGFIYKILNGEGVEQLSFDASLDAQNQLKMSITIQSQKVVDLLQMKNKAGQTRLAITRYPLKVTVQVGRSKSASETGGIDYLSAFDTNRGPVYTKQADQVQISESDWNQLFSDGVSNAVTKNGVALILDAYSNLLPTAKKVVLAGANNDRLLMDFVEMKDLVVSGRNLQRVELILNQYIDAVNKGFIKDERP